MACHTGIFPRRAPGVRLGGEERIRVSTSWISRGKPNRRKYALSAMLSSGLAMVLSYLAQNRRSLLAHRWRQQSLPGTRRCRWGCQMLARALALPGSALLPERSPAAGEPGDRA